MGGTRTPLQRKAVASVGARVRAFARDIAAVRLDGSSGRKAESILTFLDNLAQRELNSIYSGPDKGRDVRPERLRPIVPGRLDLPKKVGSFTNAAKYMPARMAVAYGDPSTIEKPDPPKPPRARMHCVDYFGLLARYDEIDRPGFALADSLPGDQAAGQFPNEKSADSDRLISNRRPRISRLRSFSRTAVYSVRCSCILLGICAGLAMTSRTCTVSSA